MSISKENVKKSINFNYENDTHPDFNCNITYSVNEVGTALLSLDYGDNVLFEMPVEMITDIYQFLAEEQLICSQVSIGSSIPNVNNNIPSSSSGLIRPTKISKKNNNNTTTTADTHSDPSVGVAPNTAMPQRTSNAVGDKASSNNESLESLSSLGGLGNVIQEPVANTPITEGEQNKQINQKRKKSVNRTKK